MREYQNAVLDVLKNGNYKQNRTSSDTISNFSVHYNIDLSKGFPLLTTKEMDGYRWDSMIHELVWYLSGEHHIDDLTDKTGIWDAWADENNNLPSAYGRFWRRYPVPKESDQLPGEAWIGEESEYTTKEENGGLVFDQLKFVIDALNNENEYRSVNSRRLIVNAWHPSNASVSDLPPCHFSFVLNVQNGKLNTHLTQRSADIALGVPFNIAAYSLLTNIIAEQTDLEVGEFSHTLVDAHIYCGKDERGEWYKNNVSELKERVSDVDNKEDYVGIRDWILNNSPSENEDIDPDNNEYGYDHIPGMLYQLSKEPMNRSKIEISDVENISDLRYEDIVLKDYDSHEPIKFDVSV